MQKKLILVGKSCSGKDYARKLLSKDLKFGVWHTTRPKREGEIEGEDYYFVANLTKMPELAITTWYNGWCYGLSFVELQHSSAFIFSLEGLKQIHESIREDFVVIYLQIDAYCDDIIFNRLKEKSMPGDNWERRYCCDRIEFTGFDNYDTAIYNPNFTYEEIQDGLEYHGINL